LYDARRVAHTPLILYTIPITQEHPPLDYYDNDHDNDDERVIHDNDLATNAANILLAAVHHYLTVIDLLTICANTISSSYDT
jgi:hypothetical protein